MVLTYVHVLPKSLLLYNSNLVAALLLGTEFPARSIVPAGMLPIGWGVQTILGNLTFPNHFEYPPLLQPDSK